MLEGLAVLGALDAPLGVYAVIGNHDAWWDEARVRTALERGNIRVLKNQSVRIQREGAPLNIVGLADYDTGEPDYLAATMEGEQGADAIAVMHSPDAFGEIPVGVALSLAGHTHCGQVTVPFVGRPIVPSVYGERYACGLVTEHGRQLFVTGGVGTSVAPLRFLNPPEIALLTIAGSLD